MASSFSIDAIDHMRYDRICLVLAPAMIVSQYLVFLLMHYIIRWRPKLTSDSIKACTEDKQAKEMTEVGWRNFSIDASQLAYSGFFHLVYGSAAIAAVSGYHNEEPIRALGDRGALLAAGDVDYIMLQESAAFMGSIFGALMLFYLFYWCIGWDKGMEQVLCACAASRARVRLLLRTCGALCDSCAPLASASSRVRASTLRGSSSTTSPSSA